MLRVLGEKLELREFGIFGAVAFAHNGRLPDDLEQRSIIIEMQRRTSEDQITELRADRCENLRTISRMCARWRDDNIEMLSDIDPDMGGRINRDEDNWRPLFTIADYIGADWPERIREAAKILTPKESESIGPMLLADIRAIFGHGEQAIDRIGSQHCCNQLAAMEGRPWAEWKIGKPITPNQLARLLKTFGIIPENVRIELDVLKGYLRYRFTAVWERYLSGYPPPEPLQRYNTTAAGASTTFQSATPDPDVADRKCEKPLEDRDCSVVTVQNGGKGLALECHHCHRPGSDADGEGDAFMHRTCLNEWTQGSR